MSEGSSDRSTSVARDHSTDRRSQVPPDDARSLFSILRATRVTTASDSWDFTCAIRDAGTVSGQFPQGYPIWIAIAYGLDGVTGTRRVIAWWAILGVLAGVLRRRAPHRSGAGRCSGRPADAYTSSRRGTRGTRTRRSSPRRCCSRVCWRTPTPTKRATNFLDRSRRHCSASRSSRDCRSSWRSARRSRRLCSRATGNRARRGFLVTLGLWLLAAGAVLHDPAASLLQQADQLPAIARIDSSRGAGRGSHRFRLPAMGDHGYRASPR